MHIVGNLHAFIWRSMQANNCNTYLINGSTPILIDPGHVAYFGLVADALAELGLSPETIAMVVATHGHPDHIEAFKTFKSLPAVSALHGKEWSGLQAMAARIKVAMKVRLSDYAPDVLLREGQLKVGDVALTVLHTPGHSPGSVCLYWPAERALFSGDLVFKNGVGRTDLPGGDGRQLKESIERVAALDVEYLLPGHGEIVSGAANVRANFEQIAKVWLSYV